MSTDCCDLGLIRPHHHLRTVCPACGELVLDTILAREQKPPSAIKDRNLRVLVLHQRTCRGSKP